MRTKCDKPFLQSFKKSFLTSKPKESIIKKEDDFFVLYEKATFLIYRILLTYDAAETPAASSI